MSSAEAQRNLRRVRAQMAGKTVREYKRSGLQCEDTAEWRREYKRLQRRQKGARLRADIAANAQAKLEATALRKSLREAAALHDAHVKRHVRVLKDRSKYAKRYETNPQAERERASRRKQALPDAYVIQQLKSMGIGREVVTSALIELKREAMQYRRMSRTIKTTIKNHLKEDHESIPKHP